MKNWYDPENLEVVDNLCFLEQLVHAIEDCQAQFERFGLLEFLDEAADALDPSEIITDDVEWHEFCENVDCLHFEWLIVFLADEQQFTNVVDLPELRNEAFF